MTRFSLEDFVRESNRIEGIHRKPTQLEMDAHAALLVMRDMNVGTLESFVGIVAGKPLRRSPGMNVRVGSHIAPPGGPEIETALAHICGTIQQGEHEHHCYAVHQQYETLHPFMDGNGRSGRALWLWMMGGLDRAPLGFLHHWYYQSLSTSRPRATQASQRSTDPATPPNSPDTDAVRRPEGPMPVTLSPPSPSPGEE